MKNGLSFLLLFFTAIAAHATEWQPPVLPVGLDAFRQWERWPEQRIGERVYMRSTYDRRGGNEGADASHFLYQLADDRNVTLDVAGAGVLYFARYNHWHGSPWHYVVDGKDYTVQESTSADPLHPVTNSVFLPEKAFPPPLAVTWADTRGADLSWVPIGFKNSFRMDYTRTHYGTGYYIYAQYLDGAALSRPIASWNPDAAPDKDVLDLIARAGSDLAPVNNIVRNTGFYPVLNSGLTNMFLLSDDVPCTIRKLSFSVPPDQAIALGRTRLRVTWDRRKQPSIDAPLALFFGAGTLYNRDQHEYLVRAFPINIHFMSTNVELACYFPMPYFKSAKFELIGPEHESVTNLNWQIVTEPLKEQPASVGYFHATYRDHSHPEPGQDLLLLDTRETEGGHDWSGSFIGMSWIFSDRANLSTLEGDPRFFFDDSHTPQAQGTGTEEWGGGGDYWGDLNMTLPFAGHPTGASKPAAAKNDEDKIESAYRFLLSDLMPFGKNARICLEHGGTDESDEHYQTVTYWYGAPAPALVQTDEFKVGDPESELAHGYLHPEGSAPLKVRSRYEWGVDTLKAREIYRAFTDIGRATTNISEFTLNVDPKNLGVMLRRKLDYTFPNQRANVFILDDLHNWHLVGVWSLAGSSTCVYSNPKSETGETQHVVETSNRCFRDDEFLLPCRLTEGRSSIRIRLRFMPANIPLFPGKPLGPQVWTEMRYDAYCYVKPDWNP